MGDAVAGKFNLAVDRKLDTLELKAVDDLGMQALQNDVLEGLHTHASNVPKARETFHLARYLASHLRLC